MFEVRIYHKEADEYVGLFPPDDYENNFETVAKNTKPCNYLSFDGGGIDLLDENLKFYEEGDFLGYILPFKSSDIAGVNGDYAIDQGWPLIFNFKYVVEKPRNISIICKEKSIGAYRTIITSKQDGVDVTETFEFLRANSDRIVLSLPEGVTYVELYFLSAMAPNKYITISSVFYGTIESYTKFKNNNLYEEIDVLSADLPINQYDTTIVVPDGDNVKFSKNDPLAIFSGHRYYGTFYITRVERTAKNVFDISAQNVLSIYDNSNFEKWQPNTSFGGVHVSDIVKEIDEQTGLKLDAENLKNAGYIMGDKQDGSCRLALCELGWVLNYIIDSSRRDNVTFKRVPKEITSRILTNDNRIIGDAILEYGERFSSAEIYYSKLEGIENKTTETKEITGSIGDVVTVTFPTPTYFEDEFGLSSGVEFLSSTLYSAKIKLTEETGIIAYYPRLVLEETITINNPNAEINNVRKFQNITLKQRGDAVNSKVYYVNKLLKSRGKVRAAIRLRDEKAGDLIQIETAWDGIVTGIITAMSIKFGYEDIADIEVLEWNIED
jgi:hypothetical protein